MTVKERVLEYEEFKKSIVEYLEKRDNLDEIFMYIGDKGYSCNMFIDEIKNSTDVGQKLIKDIFILTLDMLYRSKK